MTRVCLKTWTLLICGYWDYWTLWSFSIRKTGRKIHQGSLICSLFNTWLFPLKGGLLLFVCFVLWKPFLLKCHLFRKPKTTATHWQCAPIMWEWFHYKNTVGFLLKTCNTILIATDMKIFTYVVKDTESSLTCFFVNLKTNLQECIVFV